MQEKRGVAHCASTFAKNGCPRAAVYAAPIFVPATEHQKALPLQELYDHPDFVDLISAREFGLVQSVRGKLLLCVVVAAASESLRELAEQIAPCAALVPCADCARDGDTLTVRADGKRFRLPADASAGTFLAALQAHTLPLPAVLAALATWCTDYDCTLFWEAAQ